MSPSAKIIFHPPRTRKLHIVRVFNTAFNKPKYNLCVEECDDGGGRFILVSTGYPEDRDRPNRAILDAKLLALPLPGKSTLSKFDLSKTFKLNNAEIRKEIDFGPLGRDAGRELASAWNRHGLRLLYGEDWRRHHETFLMASARPPSVQERSILDGARLRSRLRLHDSSSATLRACARTIQVCDDHADAGVDLGLGAGTG